jgi:hypothetical protein
MRPSQVSSTLSAGAVRCEQVAGGAAAAGLWRRRRVGGGSLGERAAGGENLAAQRVSGGGVAQSRRGDAAGGGRGASSRRRGSGRGADEGMPPTSAPSAAPSMAPPQAPSCASRSQAPRAVSLAGVHRRGVWLRARPGVAGAAAGARVGGGGAGQPHQGAPAGTHASRVRGRFGPRAMYARPPPSVRVPASSSAGGEQQSGRHPTGRERMESPTLHLKKLSCYCRTLRRCAKAISFRPLEASPLSAPRGCEAAQV